MNPTLQKRAFRGAIGLLASAFAIHLQAAVPTGYYDSADPSTPQTLRNTLHDIIDDHQRFPYTSTSTDTWDILEIADQDPDNPNNVIDIYKNASYPKAGGGNTNYNREHSWPKSYGFPSDGSDNYAYTDTHHLFIANSGYNSSRSNKPYDNCTSGCTEKTTEVNNGRGGAGQSNWTAGSFTAGSWQTWDGRKGDVARALMYMAVRYEGGTHGVTGYAEPDLILTDDRSLIESSNTGANIAVAYMGLRSVLLQWHKDDPVDDFERRHNDAVYSFQGNRNPFIDHPEYVACVFESICDGSSGGTISTPTGLSANGGDGIVSLSWTANTEAELAGYNVYRSDSANGSYVKINGTLVSTNAFDDTSVAAASTYYYKVTAVDTASAESNQSSAVSATTDGGTSSPVTAWINEIHYDNDSTDVNEGVEIAGSAGTDLNGWSLVAYNGNGGASYNTTALSGVIADMQGGFGVINFPVSGLQNGGPDGIALVDNTGSVVQFLSYEGSFIATDGPAAGMTSSDIGVAETTSTPVGHSLQLSGNGSSYSEFSWQAPATATAGSINNGQSFAGGAPVNQAPVASFTVNCSALACDTDASASTDSDGNIISYNWDFGDGATSSGVFASHTYANDGDYTMTLTITDDGGASSSTTQMVSVIGNRVWINELHYDNKGTDSGEFVELAGTAGLDLNGWSLVAYNGGTGTAYQTLALSGTIGNIAAGVGVADFAMNGLQNGGPDGIALVDNTGAVVQFLSYEGTLVAVDGAAAGMTSVDIGVSETSSTRKGHSLQLGGTGNRYADFTWQNAQNDTPNAINKNQSFN